MIARIHGSSGHNPLQQPLFFVEPEHRHLMTDIWNKKIFVTEQRKLKEEKKAHQRIEVLVAKSRAEGITWTNIQKLLDRPIGHYQASELDIQPATDEPSPIHHVDGVTEERIEWTEQAMLDLHEGVLNYSLQLLRTRGNAKEKLEILNWIWADDVYDFVTRKIRGVNKQVPIRADQIPFSFQTCCRLSGYRYDLLRDGLAWEMRTALAALGFQPRN